MFCNCAILEVVHANRALDFVDLGRAGLADDRRPRTAELIARRDPTRHDRHQSQDDCQRIDGAGRRHICPGDTDDLFVVDQTGKIYVIHDGVLQSTPLLDISSIEATLSLNPSYDERGLLGLAFSPGFSNPSSSGYHTLYTYESEKAGTAPADLGPATGAGTTIDHQNVLVQWKVSAANPDVVDMSTRKDLLRENHPESNHNGGTIAFGPDGDLYLGIGDGGNANDSGNGHLSGGNAQSLSVVMGKMLRIDPNGNNSANGKYGIPPTNPFVGTSGAVKEIYAYGFRNPFKFSFDSATGNLIVGDVGQNEVEEVDQVTSGGNYGWVTKEGTFLFNQSTGMDNPTNSPGSPPGLIDPLVEYDHNAGQAVIGGFVYHGSLMPQLDGDYVFGDLSNGSANGRISIPTFPPAKSKSSSCRPRSASGSRASAWAPTARFMSSREATKVPRAQAGSCKKSFPAPSGPAQAGRVGSRPAIGRASCPARPQARPIPTPPASFRARRIRP